MECISIKRNNDIELQHVTFIHELQLNVWNVYNIYSCIVILKALVTPTIKYRRVFLYRLTNVAITLTIDVPLSGGHLHKDIMGM